MPPVVRHKDNLPRLHHAVLDPLTRRKSPVHLATVVALPVRRSRKVGRRYVPKLRPSDQAEPSNAVLHHLHAAVTAPKRQDAALRDACEEIRHLIWQAREVAPMSGESAARAVSVASAASKCAKCDASGQRACTAVRGRSGEEVPERKTTIKWQSVAPPSRGRWPPGTRSRQQRRPARQ